MHQGLNIPVEIGRPQKAGWAAFAISLLILVSRSGWNRMALPRGRASWNLTAQMTASSILSWIS